MHGALVHAQRQLVPGRPATVLPLRRRLRASVKRLANLPSAEQRVAIRTRIVLTANAGLSNEAIARQLGIGAMTASK